MRKPVYIKTLLYITITIMTTTFLLYVSYNMFLPNNSFLPVIILMFVVNLLIIGIFSRLVFKYEPLFLTAKKEAHLNKVLFKLIQDSVHVTNRDELYQIILDSAIDAMPQAQKGCIMLLNSSTNVLQFVAATGYDLKALKKTYLRLDQTYLYRESQGKIEHTVFVNDPFSYDRENFQDENINQILEAGHDLVFSTLSTPVIYNETLYGMINIDSSYRNAYSKEDEHIIELFALEIVSVLKLYNSIEKVNYYINHDTLTDTYNRNFFNELLEKKLKYAREKNMHLSLITMDINNLKQANDQYGHECGDHLLIEFSYGIKKHINSKYHFARYSGDQFQLLLEDMSLIDSQQIVNTIKSYFSNHPLIFKGHIIPINFCYGIVTFPEDQKSFKGLINLADQRMYQQKRHLYTNT